MNDDYSKHFSENSYWDKIKGFAKQAGKEVVKKSLILYYVGNDPETPVWAKGVVGAALGYFIFPLDAIPDFTPIVGYADDLGALAAAMAAMEKWTNGLGKSHQLTSERLTVRSSMVLTVRCTHKLTFLPQQACNIR